jgi:hypothetical protein
MRAHNIRQIDKQIDEKELIDLINSKLPLKEIRKIKLPAPGAYNAKPLNLKSISIVKKN